MTNYIIDIYQSFDESHLNQEIVLDEGELRDFEGNPYKAVIIIKDLKEADIVDDEE